MTTATEVGKTEVCDAVGDSDDDKAYWFVGAQWSVGDQLQRFMSEGVWQNGYTDQFLDQVRKIRPASRSVRAELREILLPDTGPRKRGCPAPLLFRCGSHQSSAAPRV